MDTTLNPLAADISGRRLIEASAGTGKTWNITALYARLLLEKALSVSNILVVTYTTAATAELRDRIRTRLAELLAIYDGAHSSDPLLNALHERFNEEQHHRRLRLAVHGFDEASIFTIHGFCQRALQDAAFDAGGDFDNELTQDDSELIDEILTDLWRQELAQAGPEWASFLEKSALNPQSLRQKLRSYLGKPYLTVVPKPLAQQTAKDNVLYAHWHAAQRIWQQDSAAFCHMLCEQEVLNKQSYSPSKIRAWQQVLNAYFTDFACVYDANDALARLATSQLTQKTKKGGTPPVSHVSDALQALLEAIEQQQPDNDARLISLTARLLEQLNQLLPLRKTEQRILAFDDLLNRLAEGLNAEGGALLAENLRTQYPVALIDEFQDTDPIQYQIFSNIYREGGDLCFVGDPKQAIYAFRGADLATYLTARRESGEPYTLDTNHRSTPELISALNSLFAHPVPFADADLQYRPVKAAAPRHAPLILPEATHALNWVWMPAPQADKERGLTKGFAEQLAASDCAARIAALLQKAEDGAVYFAQEPPKPLKGGDIAVLVASHREASLIAEKLAECGVASVRRGKDNVWNSEEAEEFEAVLRAYAEPSREAVLRHALLTRLLGRSAHTLIRYQTDPGSWDRERERAETYHSKWQQGFMAAFAYWLDTEHVAERLLALPDGERRLTNLLHLAELLQEESMARPGLEALLAWFSAQRLSESHGDAALLRLESDAERVQIVTIHTSKGLEYPLVFCPFLWNGRLLANKVQSVVCHDQNGHLLLDLGSPDFATHTELARAEMFAEKLRLVYVALTRARTALWVHWGPVQQGADFEGAEGLHTSALAWLLHGRDKAETKTPSQALSALADAVLKQGNGRIYDDLHTLVSANAHTMCVTEAITHADNASSLLNARAPKPGELNSLNRVLKSAWKMGSFSSITFGKEHEAPDRDEAARTAVTDPGEGFYAFPRGARSGICLHAIFERWANHSAPLAELVPQALTEYGIDETLWGEVTLRHLEGVLATPLKENLSLNSLSRALPELGFTFAVSQLEWPKLQRILLDPQYGLSPRVREAAKTLKFETLTGFMRGFIDLTFEHQGCWYILDYKSNWLGPDASAYQADALEDAIAQHHYYLQYLIYLLALRRYLQHRLGDGFANHMLGGAYYLFLRAMPDAGVYFARPSDALLDALDHLFS